MCVSTTCNHAGIDCTSLMFQTTFMIGLYKHCSSPLKYCKDDIEVLDDKQGIFSVKGSKGKSHRVTSGVQADGGMPSGTCAAWQQWHIPCIHFLQYSTYKLDGHGTDFTQSILRAHSSAWTPSHLIII